MLIGGKCKSNFALSEGFKEESLIQTRVTISGEKFSGLISRRQLELPTFRSHLR